MLSGAGCAPPAGPAALACDTAPAIPHSGYPIASADAATDADAALPDVDAAKEQAPLASPGDAGTTLAEVWKDGGADESGCVSYRDSDHADVLREPRGPRALFSWDGYLGKRVRMERTIEGKVRRHCVQIAWPREGKTVGDKELHVAARLNDAWLRAVENTLARVPWRHLSLLQRIVIDDRPSEHGIAPFDRRKVDDARDGHTIWLHERMFEEPNHWAHGNHGSYWSYHADQDGVTLGGAPRDHALFSPVLLHELGHLVAYSIVNGQASNETVPRCARICGDDGGCKGLSDEEREKGCISPYCMPFKFETGTENWAEQYRFFYQSSVTRALLETAESPCLATLMGAKNGGINDDRPPPWEDGLPDIPTFQRSLWKSCGEKACKKM